MVNLTSFHAVTVEATEPTKAHKQGRIRITSHAFEQILEIDREPRATYLDTAIKRLAQSGIKLHSRVNIDGKAVYLSDNFHPLVKVETRKEAKKAAHVREQAMAVKQPTRRRGLGAVDLKLDLFAKQPTEAKKPTHKPAQQTVKQSNLLFTI